MKRIIRLTESDLTRIVRRVIKEEETNQKTEMMMKNLDAAMGTDDDLGDKVERANVCNTCINKIEGANTIPACKRLCERRRKKKQDVSDCIWGFANSEYGGRASNDEAPRYELFNCLIHGFNLKMAKVKEPKVRSYNDMNSEMI